MPTKISDSMVQSSASAARDFAVWHRLPWAGPAEPPLDSAPAVPGRVGSRRDGAGDAAQRASPGRAVGVPIGGSRSGEARRS